MPPPEILLPDAVLGRSRPAPHIRWPERLDVDVAGDGLAGHIGRDGLVGHDLARDDGGVGVESRDPAVLDTGNVDAVEGRRGVALGRSPKADVPRLPLVAFDREPGESAQGIREVLVREAADRVGRNDVRDIVRVAFGFDRGHLARPDRFRDDHHFFQFFGVRLCRTDGGDKCQRHRDSLHAIDFHRTPPVRYIRTGKRTPHREGPPAFERSYPESDWGGADSTRPLRYGPGVR